MKEWKKIIFTTCAGMFLSAVFFVGNLNARVDGHEDLFDVFIDRLDRIEDKVDEIRDHVR